MEYTGQFLPVARYVVYISVAGFLFFSRVRLTLLRKRWTDAQGPDPPLTCTAAPLIIIPFSALARFPPRAGFSPLSPAFLVDYAYDIGNRVNCSSTINRV